jgi:hypothetical protein
LPFVGDRWEDRLPIVAVEVTSGSTEMRRSEALEHAVEGNRQPRNVHPHDEPDFQWSRRFRALFPRAITVRSAALRIVPVVPQRRYAEMAGAGTRGRGVVRVRDYARSMAESAAAQWDAASDAGEATVLDGERRWWGRHVHELRWQAELVRLLVDPVFRGQGIVRGDGGPVLLIPGFLAGDASLFVMADWLGRIGHRAYGSGIRLNVDCSNRALLGLERRLERVAEGAGRPVALVGHSRGGHFAKALGHRRPELVSRVVSIGAGLDTPFAISQPTLAAVAVARVIHARTTDRRSCHGCFTSGCSCEFSHHYRAAFPERIPLTSIFSKGDGVVRWQSCVVPYAHCVEVTGSHVGLAFNRKAYRALAEALA